MWKPASFLIAMMSKGFLPNFASIAGRYWADWLAWLITDSLRYTLRPRDTLWKNLHIQSEYGEIRTRQKLYFGTLFTQWQDLVTILKIGKMLLLIYSKIFFQWRLCNVVEQLIDLCLTSNNWFLCDVDVFLYQKFLKTFAVSLSKESSSNLAYDIAQVWAS